MPYSHITFARGKTQLANRFGDPSKTHWTDQECGILITEAMRTWNAATQYWKTRSVFNTTSSTSFYDLPSILPAGVVDYTVKDQDLVGSIELHLTEKYSVNTWTGSAMFVLSDVTNALQRRRNQFLLETAMIVTNTQPNLPPPPIGRVPLNDNVIDVRWLWYKDTSIPAVYTNMWRVDEWALNAFSRGWTQNAANPKSYSVATVPPLTVQLAPVLASGTLDMLSVNTPTDLDPATGVLMNIPDDFTWAVKFGALADLFSQDGTARDVLRAEYCEKRYREGVELARMGASVLQCQVNDVPVQVVSIEDLQNFRQNWRNRSGQPAYAAMGAWNLLALADVPDDVYGISLDLVQNAPIPATDGDPLQLGREELDAVLNYAAHLGSLKHGGQEFIGTLGFYENFFRLASVYNEKLRSNSAFWAVLGDRAVRPQERKSYRDPSKAEGVNQI